MKNHEYLNMHKVCTKFVSSVLNEEQREMCSDDSREMDIVPCPKSILVTNYLTEMSDFWMFPKLKEKLRVCRFEGVEEMKEAVMSILDTFTLEEYKVAFKKWVERYIKCIEIGES
ncbi:hypothetical protein Pcinc_019361 [Petrolisthes cinctipes]|uniref:Uncharacterized protein n=1 Tax=Petrolisthes cinctipes TaxID=88211 RepID=A0AAE1KLN7_PETCI|nr:hypothetical protein Pcinc_019361 [Petrolisthes cinctipes]